MPVYAARADMILRFGEPEIVQLTDRAEPRRQVIDDAVLNRALDNADGQIDSALAARYILPLASVPKVLVATACDLARYHLYGDGAGESVRQRYQDALKYLSDLARGVMTLGLGAGNVPIAAATGGAEFGESRQDFAERV
jgi:phage gp36-like protein